MSERNNSVFDDAILEKFRLGIVQRLSKEMLGASVQFVWDALVDEIEVQVHGWIWSEELERVSVRYPADWWEALKERWAPLWFRHRWPVRHVQKELVARALYPRVRYLPDPDGRLESGRLRLEVLGSWVEGRQGDAL